MQPSSLFAFTMWLLLQLLNNPYYNRAMTVSAETKDDGEDQLSLVVGNLMGPIHDANTLFSAGLSNYRLCTMFTLFDDDLGFWVRPRLTMWFSRFLLEQYDDHWWVQMFQMSKKSVFVLADLLKPHVQRHDTKYMIAIHKLIRELAHYSS